MDGKLVPCMSSFWQRDTSNSELESTEKEYINMSRLSYDVTTAVVTVVTAAVLTVTAVTVTVVARVSPPKLVWLVGLFVCLFNNPP
jgi:hypothetical protein